MKRNVMKKPTVAQLMDEIAALKRRISELEMRPAVVIHNHPPALQQQTIVPHVPITQPLPWRFGEVYCGVTTAVASGAAAIPWNGPRNPDGSCAPVGSATFTAV